MLAMAFVLLIDDDHSVRLSITAYLEDRRHEVIEASGG